MFPQLQQNQLVLGGQYQIIRFISKGTGGHVYEVMDKTRNLKVALKIQQYISDHEYQSLCTLYKKGPFQHITNILSFNEPNNFFQFYSIGMDLADGCFVHYWEANQSRLSQIEILNYFLQIAQGLDEIHNKVGLIHRDMKLENVVYKKQNGDLILQICDTGLMRDNLNDLRKTNMIGTPYYMPPEQINQTIYNEKVDIWSLGVILFEMTSKIKMIDDSDYKILLAKITRLSQEQIDKIIDDQQKISYEIKKLIKKMIVVKPENRLSASSVVGEVQKLIKLNSQRKNSSQNQAFQFPQQFNVIPQQQIAFQPQFIEDQKKPQQFQQIRYQQQQPIQFQQQRTQDNQFQQFQTKEANQINQQQREDAKLREEEQKQKAKDQEINQMLELQKKKIEEQLQKDKQNELERQFQKIEDEYQQKKQQIEVEEELAFQKLKKQIGQRKNQMDSELKQLLSELQEAHLQNLEQIEQNSMISNAQKKQQIDKLQEEFEQQQLLKNQQFNQQLQNYQLEEEQNLKCKLENQKRNIIEQQKKYIENQVSQQFQRTYEQKCQQLYKIKQFKEDNMQELNQSKAFIYCKQIEQLSNQTKENEVLGTQLKIFDNLLNQRIDQLQKVESVEKMQQFEKSKQEYPQIQYKVLREFIESSYCKIKTNNQQQENQGRLLQQALECQQIQVHINALIDNFTQELMEFPLPDLSKMKFDDFLNRNQANKVYINQILQNQQVLQEDQLSEFKQNLQELEQNLNKFIQIINEEMINQLEQENNNLVETFINLKHLISSFNTIDEESLKQFSIILENLKYQRQIQLKISQVVELYEQFSNLKTFISYCSAQFQFFLKFSNCQLEWLQLNIVQESFQHLIQLQHVLIEYCLNFKEKSHYKKVGHFIKKLQQITFENFFLELLRKIILNLNNGELLNFYDLHQQEDFISYQNQIKSVIKSINESKQSENLKQQVTNWKEALEQINQELEYDEVLQQIKQELKNQIDFKEQQANSFEAHIQELNKFQFKESKYDEIILELFINLRKQQEFKSQVKLLEQDMTNLSFDQQDDSLEDKLFQCFSNIQILPTNELISLKHQSEEEFDNLQVVAILHLIFKIQGYLERYNSYIKKQELKKSQNIQKSQILQNFLKYLEQVKELLKQRQIPDMSTSRENQTSSIYQFQTLIESNLIKFDCQKQFWDEFDKLNASYQKLYFLFQKIYQELKNKILQLNSIKMRSQFQNLQPIKSIIKEDYINTFEIYQNWANFTTENF